jgi:predicted nucleic acid-binding protein
VIVVDTNIIAYLFVRNDEFTPVAKEVYRKDRSWIAPSLWRYEFFNLLNLYRKRSLLDEENMKAIYFKALETVETVDLIDLTILYTVAIGSDLTGYDCQFVALASEKGLPLITEDRKIRSEFPDLAISLQEFLD